MMVLQELVRPGSTVKKGETVAEFDRQYMLNRLDDYQASVVQSEASFRKMQAEAEVALKAHEQTIRTAKGDLDKALLDLKTTPVVSAITAERLRLAAEEAEARYKQLLSEVKFVHASEAAQRRNAELELKQTKVEFQRAQANADRMVMRAPIDGLTVMQTMFRGGEFDQIKQGDQLYPGQPFLQVVDTSSMVINATVNQTDVEKLRIGQKARVRFDAFPDLELPARIHAIGSVTRSSRYRPDYVKELGVTLKLDQMDARVIPDLSVSVDIVLESEETAVVVPRHSVFASAGGAFVFTRQPNGWQRQTVELGPGNNVDVAIRSGVRPGDVIALEEPPAAAKP